MYHRKKTQIELDILAKSQKAETLEAKILPAICIYLNGVKPSVELVISMQVIKQLNWIWVTSAFEQLGGTAYFHNERIDLISLFSLKVY